MKKYALIATSLLMFSCAEKKTDTTDSSNQTHVPAEINSETDSLKTAISENENDTILSEDRYGETEESDVTGSSNSDLRDLSGKHSLTLQWISWDKPGTVNFRKTGDGKYSISGIQKKGKDYVKIEGQIIQISNEELNFEGTIETFVGNNGGKCLRTGPQLFLVTQNRKYWRLQSMEECFGLTDYIDIYF